MKKILTLSLLCAVHTALFAGDHHVVKVSTDNMCLSTDGSVTITLYLKGFTHNVQITWQSESAAAWRDIPGQTGKYLTTDTTGIFRALVKEEGDCPEKDSVYFSPDVWVESCSSTLPLTMGAFTGSIQRTSATLHWSTIQEINTSLFEVQESTDGMYFSTVATVPAAGNSAVQKNYTATVSVLPKDQTLLFRLKTVDKDHAVSFSPVIRLSSTAISQRTLAIYPNPVQATINLLTYSGNHFSITTVSGMKVSTGIVTGTAIDVSRLPAGTYILTVGTGSTQFVKY